MGRFKIIESTKTSKELDFEDDENISNSYYKIRSEFRKKGIKQLKYLLTVLMILVIYFAIIYPIFLIPNKNAGITTLQPSDFGLTINWTLFSFGTYLIFYFIKIVLMRATPSLKKYIKSEIENIGFKTQEKRKSWISFLVLNSIAVLLLFLMELKIIYFHNLFFNTLFRGILIIYLIISIITPIIWRFYYDGLIVPIKGNYQVFLNPHYSIRKSKVKDYQLIGIYLTSNRIAFKFDKYKKRIYTKIAGSRWLPRKRKSIISKYGLSPFLRFNEFSTPLNFQKQFLNIVLALQEWDIK
ncbi:MAG: hypothetical protein ACFFBV_12460, partial [Promethearchaeota archaeon]